MTIRELLRRKGSNVITTQEDSTVYNAIQMMVKNHVGSVVVLNEEAKPAGIFTERDVLRFIADDCDGAKEKKLKDVMTTDLIIAAPDDDTEAILKIITEKRLRHLPVVDSNRIVGLISIGDIVKAKLTDSRFEIRYLRDYIMGKF